MPTYTIRRVYLGGMDEGRQGQLEVRVPQETHPFQLLGCLPLFQFSKSRVKSKL